MENKYILFDIGANTGTDSLEKTKLNPYVETYAFEPTPYLTQYLAWHSKEFSNRYHIIPHAVSNFDGISKFNIGIDWGCSSLNEISDNINEIWPGWPGGPEFRTIEIIDVGVIRLDTWFRRNNLNIDKIDFFHCDTQGSDLKVLQGMGDYIELIQEGVVECARDENSKLYKENHTEQEMIEFLFSKGFDIPRREWNDQYGCEINVFFKKR
jgi:FkbM family methyltransferase